MNRRCNTNHPLILSLSKDGRLWFDQLTMSVNNLTMGRGGGL